MNKILFSTLLACLVFLVGCSRESAEERYGLNPYGGVTPGLGGGGNSVLIKAEAQGSTVDYYSASRIIYKVKDNTQGQSNNTYEFKYNSSGKVDSVIVSTNQGIFAKGKVEYNGDRIKKIKVINLIQVALAGDGDEVDYIYDNVGRVTQIIYKSWDPNDQEFVNYYKTIYTYIAGNNISKVDLYTGDIQNNVQLPGTLFSSYSYGSYDTMRSPYSTLNREAFVALAGITQVSGLYLQRTSPNNPLTMSISMQGIPTIPGGFAYTYNSEGLPTGNGAETYTYGPVQ